MQFPRWSASDHGVITKNYQNISVCMWLQGIQIQGGRHADVLPVLQVPDNAVDVCPVTTYEGAVMKALFNAFQKGKGVKTVIQGVDMYSTFCLKTRDTLLGLALGFLLILLGGGCSPRVEHSIVPSQPQVGPFPPVAKSTVVILPMADYSQGERPDEAARRQAKVMASLGYELYKIGLVSAVQEDVNAYLMRRGIIRPIRESNKTEVVYYNANQWGELTNAVVDEVKNTAFALPRPDEVEAVGLGP